MFMPRLLLATALALLPTAAFADQFTVYQAQGVFQNGLLLGGTVTLDTTSGVFTASSLTLLASSYTVMTFTSVSTSAGPFNPSLPGSYNLTFTGSPAYTNYSISYASLLTPSSGRVLQLCLSTQVCSPPGYGSALLSFTGNYGQYGAFSNLSTGQLTPVAAVTPEPSSLLLLGTGLVGTGAAFRRRLFC